MERKRNRLEIIYDILRVISEKNGKIKPTHVLYKSNLSYNMMEEYLNELIEKEFIKKVDTPRGKSYMVTDKGFEYMSKYGMVKEFANSFGLE
jgi:predicted transcriptional regulator